MISDSPVGTNTVKQAGFDLGDRNDRFYLAPSLSLKISSDQQDDAERVACRRPDAEPLRVPSRREPGSRGIELEAKTELRRGWNLPASYTRHDVEVTPSDLAAELGKRPSLVPRDIASVWMTARYRW